MSAEDYIAKPSRAEMARRKRALRNVEKRALDSASSVERKRRRRENAKHNRDGKNDCGCAFGQRLPLRGGGGKVFVAIDSEGISSPNSVRIGKGGDIARAQRTAFWAAGNERHVEYFEAAPRLAGLETGYGNDYSHSASGATVSIPAERADDDRHLHSIEIIEWLLSLPKKFGPSIFVWFGSSYDCTQIFCDLPYEKAWEIQHGKPFDEPDARKSINRSVYWREYAICYIKQKSLRISRIGENGKPIRGQTITIFDTFGFFQTSFLKACESIPGSANSYELKLLKSGKAKRAEFDWRDIRAIKRYTACELRVLARMMEQLRDSLNKLDIKLSRWQGAGSIASAMMRKHGTKSHYWTIKTSGLEEVQEWAHHAFFGGRIETLKQGITDEPLFGYDIRSAYPAHMSRLPSMAGGTWRFIERPNLDDLKRANVLSMFKVRFKTGVETGKGPLVNQIDGAVAGPHFYPFPWRGADGRILYPPVAYGIYMADEVRAAFEWRAAYVAHYRDRKRNSHDLRVDIDLEAAWIFEPNHNSVECLSWLSDIYMERKAINKKIKETGIYDITEKVLKLGFNSVYGKTAQSVGGASGAPSTACPWYAAAITAGTRAQLLRAALAAPIGSIVTFQTDGIVSKRKIPLAIGTDLGEWEEKQLGHKSYFVQPGIYHIEGASKHRGIKLALLETESWRQWLDAHLPDAFRSTDGIIEYPYRYYITLGSAVASRERFELIGHWVDGTRELNVNNLGHKRAVPFSRKLREARAETLVDTIPLPVGYYAGASGDPELSARHSPEWLDPEQAAETELEMLNEEIALAKE